MYFLFYRIWSIFTILLLIKQKWNWKKKAVVILMQYWMVLNIFYALKRLENAEWTLIFLVPAEYVATNTLRLVNFVMVFIVIFTVIVAVCVMLGISFVMRRNQQEAIRAERENNAKLETVNTELRQAKQRQRKLFRWQRKRTDPRVVFCQYVSRYTYSYECNHWYYVFDQT